ncbi:MAG TPA: F0F1 ATP synthase subunit delta [Patescibacteria group bacterium]|jgi:F0F1-type ATP synthase delta subunit|nr:F0F1 ATP synthase subunit delta [Patescibacteria group bacterium]
MEKTASFYKLVGIYAQSFVNVFSTNITIDEYRAMQMAHDALIKNHRLLSLLQVSFLNHQELKKKCLAQIIHQFRLPQSLYTLGLLLISCERMYLFPFILKKITLLYEKEMNIMEMRISYSHNISEETQKQCILLLRSLIHSDIKPVFLIDTSLIAGVRAQSKTVLWEHSVKKMLKSIKTQVQR